MKTLLNKQRPSTVSSDLELNRTSDSWKTVKHGLVSTLTAAMFSGLLVSGSADARVRGMNFAMDQIASETINASAHGHGCNNGAHELSQTVAGNMVYQRTIDQTMIDQMNSVMSVGGSSRITFTLRTGLSVFGNGHAIVDGTVTVSVAGNTIATYNESTETPPGGTTSNSYIVTIDPSVIAGMSVGGSITVTAAGTGEAHANGCGSTDQAIASWYFTNGGKPTIGSSPY